MISDPTGRILCIGMPVRDLIFRLPDVPARGAKVRATHFDELCGGNAPNAAIAIARLGGAARLAGPMGDESIMQPILDQLIREGIETTHVVRVPGAATPLSTIMIDVTGERTAVTYRDPKLWTVTLPESNVLLNGVDVVLVENRCATFAIDLCTQARKANIPVVVDADRMMPQDDALLVVSSHIIFSADALRATSGRENLTAALDRMSEFTSAFLAVTNGDQGVIWRDEASQTCCHMPAFQVSSVDTLGAGDVFHGAFALALAEKKEIEAALRFSSAAAALKCTGFGGAFAAPQRLDVEGLLDRSGKTASYRPDTKRLD